jgi:hypothetical protein
LLATFALSSSWKVAGTLATTVLPLLVLASILDTSLVTIVRLIERRP